MEPGDLIQDRYSLDGLIGTGGMAEVWKATDTHLARTVAVKFLDNRLADDPEFLVRFFSEAQSAARVSHPNVVGVIDFGQSDDRPFLIMEYVDGGSLKDLIGDPIVEERAIALVSEAAKGAGAAHKAGLVHRDIKPANILITGDRVKLADFGIAALSGAERFTATGDAIGSPYYISPEQAMGKEATPRSDVYALGLVLYELLTGTRPFEGDNIAAITIAQVETEPEPPSARVPGIDASVEALVLRCLAKDPAQRPTDGDALVAEIAALDVDSTAPFATVGGATAWTAGRKLALAGALLLAAGILAALSFSALSLPSDTADASSERIDIRKPKPTRSATPTAVGAATDTTSTSSPTPTPTKTPKAEAEKEEQEEAEEEEEPTPEPTETQPESTPTPTPQPSGESTP